MNVQNIGQSYALEIGKAALQQNQAQQAGQIKQAAKEAAAQNNSAPGDKLKKVCGDMEAVFINILLSQMRNTVPHSGLLPKNNGEKIMQSMLDTELAGKMSAAGGIGLADMLYRQLTISSIKNDK